VAEGEKRFKEPQDFNYPKELGYIKEHQWLRKEDNSRGRVGITDYAQYKMTEIIYSEIAPVGTEVKAHAPFASIESKKAVSDVCAKLLTIGWQLYFPMVAFKSCRRSFPQAP